MSTSGIRGPAAGSCAVPLLFHPVAIEGIPRCGPFRLHRGLEAMTRAADGMRAALAATV